MLSTDNARTQNNVFRHEYRTLSEQEKLNMQLVKDTASTLHDIFKTLNPTREISLAITKLEEAVMWAVKGITGPG